MVYKEQRETGLIVSALIDNDIKLIIDDDHYNGIMIWLIKRGGSNYHSS